MSEICTFNTSSHEQTDQSDAGTYFARLLEPLARSLSFCWNLGSAINFFVFSLFRSRSATSGAAKGFISSTVRRKKKEGGGERNSFKWGEATLAGSKCLNKFLHSYIWLNEAVGSLAMYMYDDAWCSLTPLLMMLHWCTTMRDNIILQHHYQWWCTIMHETSLIHVTTY